MTGADQATGVGTSLSTASVVDFAPPGVGEWRLDDSHHGRRPLSRFVAQAYLRALEDGTAEMFARYGLPLARIQGAFVNGCLYSRVVALGEADAAELHRRDATAAEAWRTKVWRAETDRWFDHDREQVIAANRSLQAVDLSRLDDGALAAHAAQLLDHFAENGRLNMAYHGGDIVPVGDFLAHCRRWGIAVSDATALLRGASPASIATTEILGPAARAIAAAPPGSVTSVESVRGLGPEAAASVDAWLEHFQWRIITTDDLDGPCLAERPAALLASLLASMTDVPEAAPQDLSSVRAKVPADQLDLFDELLAEARYGLRQRDDVVGIRWYWPSGLLRRALLEAGRRLAARGALHAVDHVVELTPEEFATLMNGGAGPTADEVSGRARFRDDVTAAGPPSVLGSPDQAPPRASLPPATARATAAMMGLLAAGGTPPADRGQSTEQTPPVRGVGIGRDSYTGRARVATGTDDALDRLEPGDVLVAPLTGPTYNSIMPLLGALVVEAGGPMSHAAIVSREFGLPAVIGAAGATTSIPDGALIQVDPARGEVTVLTS